MRTRLTKLGALRLFEEEVAAQNVGRPVIYRPAVGKEPSEIRDARTGELLGQFCSPEYVEDTSG